MMSLHNGRGLNRRGRGGVRLNTLPARFALARGGAAVIHSNYNFKSIHLQTHSARRKDIIYKHLQGRVN